VPPSGDTFSETLAELLRAYGTQAAAREAHTADAAVQVAAALGGSVVLKVLSPDITHKTDAGGVALDLCDAAAVRAAFARIVSSARTARPGARVDGVTVQPMITRPHGLELLLGAKQTPPVP
jgi:acetyltransferase